MDNPTEICVKKINAAKVNDRKFNDRGQESNEDSRRIHTKHGSRCSNK